MGFHALDSLFLLLLSEDDEGSTVFVECETHGVYISEKGTRYVIISFVFSEK